MYSLKFEDFKAWLLSRQDQSFVRYHVCHCPIAQYIQERDNPARLSVRGSYVYASGARHALPKWAQYFISYYDSTGSIPAALEEAQAHAVD